MSAKREHPNRVPVALVIGPLAVAILAVVLLWALAPPAPTMGVQKAPAAVLSSSGMQQPHTGIARTPVPLAEPHVLRVCVVERSTGSGIPSASIYYQSAQPELRPRFVGRESFLASTLLDGVAELPIPAQLPAKPGAMLIVASGFLPAVEALDWDADRVLVGLDRAHCLRVRCEDESGTAVPDARVVVSQWGGWTELPPFGVMPSANQRDAAHVARSGVDGIAVFDSLPAGNYLMHATHPDLAWVLPMRQWANEGRSLIVPGSAPTIVFRQPLGCNVSFDGDRVVYQNLRYAPGAGTRPLVGWNSAHGLPEMRRQLAASNPKGATAVVVMQPERPEGNLPAVILDVCLEKAGWLAITVSLRPWREALGAPELRAAGTAGPTCRTVSLTLRNPLGGLIPIPGGGIPIERTRGKNGLPVRLLIPNGAPSVLPPGEYRIDADKQPFLAQAFPNLLLDATGGSAEQDNERVANFDLCSVDLRLTSALGTVGYATVDAACDGRHATVGLTGSVQLLMPVGRVSVSCNAGSPFGPASQYIELTASGGPLTLVLPSL